VAYKETVYGPVRDANRRTSVLEPARDKTGIYRCFERLLFAEHRFGIQQGALEAMEHLHMQKYTKMGLLAQVHAQDRSIYYFFF